MNRNAKWMIGFGFLIWLIPFLVAFLIFPLRDANRPLFESVMPVVVSICVVFFAVLYFNKLDRRFIKEGILVGIVWFVISLAIDLLMFMPESPMQMSFTDYMADIGLTYLIMPTVTVGFGYLLEKRGRKA